ncbi:ABC transporter ATP-binding protein [Anaerococcus nagyae]|uniref:ABC transporter ATP-binding protein n=1 Tax=Anaerococcus nagyae TaxID=1755241 RepID=UPI00325473DA
MIEIKNLTKIYSNGEEKFKALDGISCSIKTGELTLIIGPSGCGKTTFLNIVGLLEDMTDGEIIIDDININELNDEKEKFNFRREKIGFIYQDFNLIQSLTVYENIILTASLKGMYVDEQTVDDIASKLGISEKLNQFPSKLSGGQKQRVAIARALCAKNSILLADEPTGNLDTKTSADVMKIFLDCIHNFGVTILMVTHNLDFIKYADKVIEFVDGKIVS